MTELLERLNLIRAQAKKEVERALLSVVQELIPRDGNTFDLPSSIKILRIEDGVFLGCRT